MAITPKQAEELNDDERKKVRELEAKIDRTIQRDFGEYSERSTYYFSEYAGHKVRGELQRVYKRAGWKVEFHSDQRDGDYFVFRPKKDYGGLKDEFKKFVRS